MTRLRSRLNRRAIALLAVFAIALSGTGLASLAALTDTLNVQTSMSLITIDLKANGAQSVTTTITPWSDLPRFKTLPLAMSNAGTGSLTFNISSSSATAGDMTTAVIVTVSKNTTATACTAGNDTTGGPVGGTAITINQNMSNLTITAQPLTAGASLDLCLSYYLPAGTYTQTTNTHNFTFTATSS